MEKIFKLLGILYLLIVFNSAQANDKFLVATTSSEVLLYLNNIPKSSIIFVDIDDTLITPVSKTFRRLQYDVIGSIKKEKDKYQNFEEILSNWRLQRKIMLLDSNWPEDLLKLKQRHKVYGLTKLDSGKFGNIESMEHWRYQELKSLGIEFSYDGLISDQFINNASFYKGLFITGCNSKSQTISYFLNMLKTDTVVLIDDKEDNLEDLKHFCKQNNIKFIGILFKGLENFKDLPNPAIVALQKKYLIEKAKWLEDEEAEIMLEKVIRTDKL